MGRLETTPFESAQSYNNSEKALVDQSLMLQFNVQPNDSVRIGNQVFSIAGEINKTPGQSAITTTVAPPVFISIF